MLLGRLLEKFGIWGEFPKTEIISVTEKLECVTKNSLFVAIRGRKTDGHSLIDRAFCAGAPAAVVSPDSRYAADKRCIPFEDPRGFLAAAAAVLTENPQEKLKIIAFTGTNGKSTSAHLLWHLLMEAGQKSGLIGTVFSFDGESFWESEHTTPLPEDLFPLLAKMVENGCRFCVMEASSQALDQKRLAGLTPEIGVFTNFGQDHLDYHGSMQAYFESKLRLLSQSKQVILGIDSPPLKQLYPALSGKKSSFGFDPEAVYRGKGAKSELDGVRFSFWNGRSESDVFFPMPGIFSAENAMAALACLDLLGLSGEGAKKALSSYLPLPGRAGVVLEAKNKRVMVDFAHTPDSLEAICSAIKPLCNGRLLLVFGCGGDRDRQKRPKMAKIAAKYADRILLTDDNPRSEDPVKILSELTPVLAEQKADYEVIRPREAAICQGMAELRSGDILLLAGKGHEKTQEADGKKQPLNEVEVVTKNRFLH